MRARGVGLHHRGANHSRHSPEVQGRAVDAETRTVTRATGGAGRVGPTVGQDCRRPGLRGRRSRPRRGLRPDGTDRRRRHARAGARDARTTHTATGPAPPRTAALSHLPEALHGSDPTARRRRAWGHRHAPRTGRPLPRVPPGLFPPSARTSNLVPTGTAPRYSPRSSTPVARSRRSSWPPRRSGSWRTSRSAAGTSGG